MPPARTPTGRIVDWKPRGKDSAQKPSASGSQSQHGNRDAKPVQQTPTSGKGCVSCSMGERMVKTDNATFLTWAALADSCLAVLYGLGLCWRARIFSPICNETEAK